MRGSGIPGARLPAVLAAVLALAACGHSSAPVTATDARQGNGVLPAGALPKTQYDLANGCYALQSLARRAYAAPAGERYAATATLADAERFFMKPSALGDAQDGEQYLLHTRDGRYLAATGGGAVGVADAPSDAAVWSILGDGNGHYRLANGGQALSVGEDGLLVLSGAPAEAGFGYGFDGARGCRAFPEIGTNSSGTPFKGRGVEQPVLGFADVHVHISATDFLGGAHYGLPFHRFGVTEAVGDCAVKHGPDGHQDYVGNLYAEQPLAEHETQGWPSFVSWPAAHSLTHESMYYKWVERAWRAGLRVMVNNLVENEVLCNLRSTAAGLPQDCNEMNGAERQAGFMRALQDYVDAQEGGPGKGWFRIVTSPAEARQVINDGKLAVVLGIEISHLFNCKVTQIAGATEVSGCSESDIDAQLERLHALGVRQMFPIHEFDNAFGGNGIFNGDILNVGNFIDTGKFWATYACPEDDYFYDAGAIMTSIPTPPDGSGNPVADTLYASTGGVIPLYDTTRRQCNVRWLTELGRYAFRKMMDRKMIIEVDHLELKVKDQLLDLAEAESPQYPVVSTHGGHGGISMSQARRILGVGGIIYPYKGNGAEFVSTLNRLRPLKSPDHFFAMGYGADTNGMGAQADPRGSEATPVKYPFTLFQGSGWGPQFAGVNPVRFERQVSGERDFDVNAEGMAHYGLVADFVEEVRIEGGQPALDALYGSAEAYLQMWERTVNR